MSLYAVSKFLYQLNRTPDLQERYRTDRSEAVVGFDRAYDLADDEVAALVGPDVGYLFHLGVNGQILMHFAALHGIEWADYLQQMRDGIATHGPVREGVYAVTGYPGVEEQAVEAHSAEPGHRTGSGSDGPDDGTGV